MDHLAVLGVDRAASHRAGCEEEIFISRFDQKPDRDLVREQPKRRCAPHPTADGHLALCRGPHDRVHLALDDPARVGLEEDLRLVAWFDIPQLVLVIESKNPGIILLDKTHYGIGGDRRRAYAGPEREIRHATVGRREIRRTLEIELRINQVRFRLFNLRSGLRFRGVGGEELALEIGEITLRLLKVGPLACTSGGQSRELLDALFRQLDPWSQGGFLVRGVIELIFRSLQCGRSGFLRRLERHRIDLEKHITFFDGPVWFNRHFGYLATHARHDWDGVIHRPHIVRRGRDNVHKEDEDRERKDRNGDDDYLAGNVPRQQLELEKDQPDDDRVDDQENEFHFALTPSGLFICFEFRDARPEFFDFFVLLCHLVANVADRFVHIGAVSHFVHDRLGVSPKPRNWPEQSAKAKREQAQALNRSRLWMFFLMGNFFRQNMDEPESDDPNNRRNDEHDPRDSIGN